METSGEVRWKERYELQLKLSEISSYLLLFDKVSIIFLLCKSSEMGLDMISSMLKEDNVKERNNLFFRLLLEEKLFTIDSWQEKLLEVLAITQNYKSTTYLGYNKDQIKEKYQPKNDFKVFTVSAVRKVLYNLCESLTADETKKLVSMMNNEGCVSIEECDKDCLQYLEYNLLFWSKKGIINLDESRNINLEALISSLTSLKYNSFVESLELVVEKMNCHLLRQKFNEELQSKVQEFEYYPIFAESNVGYCIIINEKVFTNPMLTTRWGTGHDVVRLKEVFTALGFDVRVHSDLTFDGLIEKLEFYGRSIHPEHSAFVLIILSHGSENIIYTSDSQAVDISTIEMAFQAEICPILIGKPKIFIVQACQGDRWQKLFVKSKEQDDTFCDSTTASMDKQQFLTTGPQRGDSMIAWSTVQGFASFRDRHNGSWYIQELCNELWKFGDVMDLTEILTRVNNNLRNKIYNDQFMVPSVLMSFRAKLKFPYLRENEEKGRRSLLERLIFEKLFREFLEENAANIEIKNYQVKHR
ncbi:hypothetical protein RUM44_012705 [Polyplax serrata]|uniref:Caspase-8 n=1 Tax=Polyplax serrata TaxID=468196 RepID=A0ABR1BC36_POLSC